MPTDTSTLVAIGGLTILSIVLYLLFKNKNESNDGEGNSRKNVIIALKNPDIKYRFPLVYKEKVSHDTYRFRFQLPSSKHVLGIPIGQHIYLTAYVNGELVKRPYTPVTNDDSQGYFDLVIKIYPHGKMTQYLDKLSMNNIVDVSGPSGNLTYKSDGLFDIRSHKPVSPVTRKVRHLGLIAGGSGITPMYQLINALLKDSSLTLRDQHTDMKIWLLFANQTEQDILLRDGLEQLAQVNAHRFKLWYTIDHNNEPWSYSTGYINEAMLKEHMPPPSDDVLICICGPSPLVKFACLPNLHKLGYDDSMIYCF